MGFDRDGEIYIIETKLYKNPDKRLVVAQVLDYGASLWNSYSDFNDFLNLIDNEINSKFNVNLRHRLEEFFNISTDDVSDLLDNVKRNLGDGNFRFVVLMDKLHDKLRDLILFINQNSRFDIFGVELEYYRFNDYEIIIPKLFGTEVKKEVGSTTTKRKKWNWESFSQKLRENYGEVVKRAAKELLDFFSRNDIRVDWTSSLRGSFIPILESENGGFYPFAIHGGGKIEWNAPHQGDYAPAPFDKPEKRSEILSRFKGLKGVTVDPEKVNGYSALDFPLKSVSDEKVREVFFGTVVWIRDELK